MNESLNRADTCPLWASTSAAKSDAVPGPDHARPSPIRAAARSSWCPCTLSARRAAASNAFSSTYSGFATSRVTACAP